MDSIIEGGLNFLISFFTTDSNNVMSGSINKLQSSQSANINVTWLRNSLGLAFALVILSWAWAVVINGIRAMFTDNVEPLVTTAYSGTRALAYTAFIIPAVSMLIYISDGLSWMVVTSANLLSGGNGKWQSTFSIQDIAIRIQSAFVASTFGIALDWQASIASGAVYFFVIVITLAVCAYVFNGDTSVGFVVAKAALITAIFMKPVMLFVMATGGVMITRVPMTPGDRVNWIIFLIVLTALCPLIMFIISLVGAWRKRKQTIDERKQQMRSRVESLSGSSHVTHETRRRSLAWNEGKATAVGAAGLAVATKIATNSNPTVKTAATLVKVSSGAVSSYLRRKG